MQRLASPVNTRHEQHQSDVDERGPDPSRRKRIIDTLRELGNNSSLTLATALNLSKLPGVAPSPGVHQTLLKPPGNLPRKTGRHQHPVRQRECFCWIHFLCWRSNLSVQRPASPLSTPDTSNTNQTWTSEGQLRAGGSASSTERARQQLD